MLADDLLLTSSCFFVCLLRRARCEKTQAPPPPPPPGSSSSNGLQIELRLSCSLSAGSQWHLRDHQRWPICLCFAPALLNTVGEPLCGRYRAAHRHRVGSNRDFHSNRNTIVNISPWSLPLFLILFSRAPSFFPEVPAMGFSDDKGPVVFNLPSSNQLSLPVKCCRD